MSGQVVIVSGAINSGKTTKISQLFQFFPQGDGFISRKIFIAPDVWVGYDWVRLSSQHHLPLAFKAEYLPLDFDEIYRQGPFCFSARAVTAAEQTINELINSDKEPLFIDEIGPLELRGLGFAGLLRKALATNKMLYLAVRTSCLNTVIDHFCIKNVEIRTLS